MASERPPNRKPSNESNAATMPPPFDPVEFARHSERSMRAADSSQTMPVPAGADDGEVDVASEEESIEPMLSAIPCVVLSNEEIRGKPLDDEGRRLFDAIDGTMTLEELLRSRSVPIGIGFAIFRRWTKEGRVVFRRW
jgi:hypothetical protein